MNELYHHGILGQKWGDQNGPPYPLDPSDYSANEKKLAKLDRRFVRKNDKKIRKYAEKATKSEMRQYERELRRVYSKYLKNGKISRNYANAYNYKLADLMNTAIGDISTPSGKVVRFVAKRGGEIGVYTALADAGYDMNKVKTGVWNNGRIGGKKTSVGVDYGSR